MTTRLDNINNAIEHNWYCQLIKYVDKKGQEQQRTLIIDSSNFSQKEKEELENLSKNKDKNIIPVRKYYNYNRDIAFNSLTEYYTQLVNNKGFNSIVTCNNYKKAQRKYNEVHKLHMQNNVSREEISKLNFIERYNAYINRYPGRQAKSYEVSVFMNFFEDQTIKNILISEITKLSLFFKQFEAQYGYPYASKLSSDDVNFIKHGTRNVCNNVNDNYLMHRDYGPDKGVNEDKLNALIAKGKRRTIETSSDLNLQNINPNNNFINK